MSQRWLIANEDGDASSSSEEEESEEEAPVENGTANQEPADEEGPSTSQRAAPRQRINIKLTGPDVCHVCGKRGHTAGFVGAKYVDCPNKPCYLCGTQGHSTMTCPFRIAPGHGCVQAAEVSSDSLLTTVLKREGGGRLRPPPQPPHKVWQVEAAVLKLHSRRVVCIEFHPRHQGLVLSGDKRGQIALWDFDKVYERTVYTGINHYQTNALRFMPGGDGASCASASYDGTVKIFDVETAEARTLFTANARGWDTVSDDNASWVTVIGLDVLPQAGGSGAVVVAGDSIGFLHILDPRMSQPVASMQLHKKGTKIQSVAANPVDPHLLLTAGNDYQARLLDVRNLTSGLSADSKGKAPAGAPAHPAELASLAHTKVINSADFSPVTGRKILTTCQDNRLRVWDYVYRTDQAADREIVHSQNFNRYLTPFKAQWDPKDPAERLIVCGRYISEDFGGVALHPIDLLDAATGELVGELTDPNLTTISPVNKPHPQRDVIVSGSSRSLYAWFPAPREEEEEGMEARSRTGACASSSGAARRGHTSDDLPFGLQASGRFVFFDADDEDGKKKGAKKGSGGSKASISPPSAGTKTKARSRAPAAGAKAKAGAAGAGSSAAAAEAGSSKKKRKKGEDSGSGSDNDG